MHMELSFYGKWGCSVLGVHNNLPEMKHQKRGLKLAASKKLGWFSESQLRLKTKMISIIDKLIICRKITSAKP